MLHLNSNVLTETKVFSDDYLKFTQERLDKILKNFKE